MIAQRGKWWRPSRPRGPRAGTGDWRAAVREIVEVWRIDVRGPVGRRAEQGLFETTWFRARPTGPRTSIRHTSTISNGCAPIARNLRVAHVDATDATTFPAEQSFDTVISLNVLEHLGR